MIYGQGKMETNELGTNRESNEGRGRFDLLPYEAIEALSKWYEEGAKKYGDRNWEKGISVKDCINRMIRHAMKAGNGWTDEDHLSAVMWNAAAAITMMQRMPELNDHKWDVDPANTVITPDKMVGVLNYNDIKTGIIHCGDFEIVQKDNCTVISDLITVDKLQPKIADMGVRTQKLADVTRKQDNVIKVEKINWADILKPAFNGNPFMYGTKEWEIFVNDYVNRTLLTRKESENNENN